MVPNGGTYAAKFLPNSFNWASSENLVTTTGKYSASAKYVLAVDYISPQACYTEVSYHLPAAKTERYLNRSCKAHDVLCHDVIYHFWAEQ